MTPFSATPAHSELSLGQRLAGRTPVIVFVTLAVLGLAAIGWRTSVRVTEGKLQARTLAAACARAVERELAQAVTAAEALGAMAAQGGANTVTFEKLAAQLQLSRPGLLSMEWQPGGITANIVPRAGNLGIGQNLLKDAPHRDAAYAAIHRRSLIVTGPVPLARGFLGFVARMPVFVKGRDGRESFWGFVSASVRGGDLIERSQLNQLWQRGYEYRLFIPKSGPRRATVVAGQGTSAMTSAVQHRVRAFNLEMILAVQPQSGWLGLPLVGLQLLGVLLGAGLLALVAALWEERHDSRNTLAEINRKLSRETSDRTQAQDQCRTANDQAAALQAEMVAVKTSLQSAEASLADLQKQFETTVQGLSEAEDSARRQKAEADQQIKDLQERLKEQARVAGELLNTNQSELRQSKTEMDRLKKELTALKTQLEGADLLALQAADEARRRHERDQAIIADWQMKCAALEASVHALERSKAELAAAAKPENVEAQQPVVETEPPAPEPVAEEGAAQLTPAEPEMTKEATPVVELEPPAVPEPVAESAPVEPESLTNEADVAEPEPSSPAAEPVIEAVAGVGESAPPVVAIEAPEVKAEPEPQAQPEPEQKREAEAAKSAAEKPARKRKARRDQQIDLFETPTVVAAKLETVSPAPAPQPVTTVQLEPKPDPEAAPETGFTPETKPEVESAPAAPATEPETQEEPQVDVKVEIEEEAEMSAAAELPAEEAEEPTAAEPESEEEEEEVEVPALPGVAVAEGLALADGSAKKYMQGLAHFVEHHRRAAEKIRDAMVQGDTPAAERVLNGLKVAAGEIGAVVLREAAGNLDKAMHGESDPSEVEFLWQEVEKSLKELLAGLKPYLDEPEKAPTRPRSSAPRLKVDPSQLRKAVGQILPLLTDQDPGAKDCFRDNRSVFRPAFAPEAFTEFEQAVKRNDFAHGLELLKKAAKRHGI